MSDYTDEDSLYPTSGPSRPRATSIPPLGRLLPTSHSQSSPLTPASSTSDLHSSTSTTAGRSDFLQVEMNIGDLPTPGPSPVMAHFGGIPGDDGDLSIRDGCIGDGEGVEGMEEVERGVRALWRDAGYGTPGEVLDPQSLIAQFQSYTPSQRFAFLALLVPSLRQNEALVVSRKIQPTLTRDFLRELPGELALHCLSFITDAHTLTQAAQVSQYWYSLLQDEQTWKDMCEFHRFRPIRTPLRRHTTAPLRPDALDSSKQMRRRRGTTGLGIKVDRRGSAETAELGHVGLEGRDGQPEYYIPQGNPNPYAALRGAEQGPGFKNHFKHAYMTERNWLHGGRVLRTRLASAEDDGVVTSLAMNNHYIVVGMANSKIHIFDSLTTRFRCTLTGHDLGVWTLILVSPVILGPGETEDPEYAEPAKSFVPRSTSRRPDPSLNGDQSGNGPSPRASTGATRPGIWGIPPAEPVYTYHPPNMADIPSPASADPVHMGYTAPSAPGLPGPGARYHPTRSKVHPTRRMRGSDVCGSARGWPGLGQKHLVVSGGCDKQLKVWDVATGAIVHSLQGHGSTIRCLKVLDRRPIAITGSRDKSLLVWDIQKGVLLRTLTGHGGSVRCIEVAGNMAVSGSYDNTARLWNVDTGECIHVLRGHYHQIYSCAYDGERIVTGSLDSTVRIWSAATGECLALLQGHTSLVGQLQLIGDHLITGGSDGRIITFDLSTYECLHRLCAHDSSVTSLQFDERFIISGGMDGRVKLWDTKTGTFIRELSQPSAAIWRVGCRDDRVLILCQRAGQTILEVVSFRPGDVFGKKLTV